LLVDAFLHLALFAIGGTTVWSAAAAFYGMVSRGRADLQDILLLFIYLEIGAMVGIYFKTMRLPVRYLIYIAITALGRVLRHRPHRRRRRHSSSFSCGLDLALRLLQIPVQRDRSIGECGRLTAGSKARALRGAFDL
jgi:hypothetical protein